MATTTTAKAPARAAADAQKIQALEAQVTELQGRLENSDELNQILWLNDRYSFARTTTSNKQLVRFSAQKSSQRQDGSGRAYGPYKNFVAYDEDLVAAVTEILQSNDKLVRITAFESPWLDNSKRSDWVVTSITVIPRVAPEQQHAGGYAQPNPYSGEPSSEEAPF